MLELEDKHLPGWESSLSSRSPIWGGGSGFLWFCSGNPLCPWGLQGLESQRNREKLAVSSPCWQVHVDQELLIYEAFSHDSQLGQSNLKVRFKKVRGVWPSLTAEIPQAFLAGGLKEMILRLGSLQPLSPSRLLLLLTFAFPPGPP